MVHGQRRGTDPPNPLAIDGRTGGVADHHGPVGLCGRHGGLGGAQPG